MDDALLKSGLSFLAQEQLPNGSFLGKASVSSTDFSVYNTHYTPFFTSLIITSLRAVPSASHIGVAGAEYVATQASSAFSWNYWQRDSPDYAARPYPDDLDDTACAVSALSIWTPQAITGSRLAAFVHLLVSAEIEPGGPYRTWLVADEAAGPWNGIDVAVNANIGYCLSIRKVHVQPARGISPPVLEKSDLGLTVLPQPYRNALFFITVGTR